MDGEREMEDRKIDRGWMDRVIDGWRERVIYRWIEKER